MISEKAWSVIKNFNLPEYNLIPVKIDTFNTNYFLIGFSKTQSFEIDFEKSVFFEWNPYREKKYKSLEEYNQINAKYAGSNFELIKLKKKYNYDIINLQIGGIFMSDRLFEAINNNGIIGFKIFFRGKLEN
jgi:hypothetical protein